METSKFTSKKRFINYVRKKVLWKEMKVHKLLMKMEILNMSKKRKCQEKSDITYSLKRISKSIRYVRKEEDVALINGNLFQQEIERTMPIFL